MSKVGTTEGTSLWDEDKKTLFFSGGLGFRGVLSCGGGAEQCCQFFRGGFQLGHFTQKRDSLLVCGSGGPHLSPRSFLQFGEFLPELCVVLGFPGAWGWFFLPLLGDLLGQLLQGLCLGIIHRIVAQGKVWVVFDIHTHTHTHTLPSITVARHQIRGESHEGFFPSLFAPDFAAIRHYRVFFFCSFTTKFFLFL